MIVTYKLIVTHQRADLDALGAIWLLKRYLFQEKECRIFFWDGNPETLRERVKESQNNGLIFVDTPPPPGFEHEKMIVFDHHNSQDEEQQVTATKKVIEYLLEKFLEFSDSEKRKFNKLINWTQRADYKGVPPHSLANVIKRLHLIASEQEVWQWTDTALTSFMKVESITPEFQDSFREFKDILRQEIESAGGNQLFNNWLKKTAKAFSDLMSLPRIFGFICEVYGFATAEKWLQKGLKGLERDQELFREAEKDFQKAVKIKIGKVSIVIANTDNPAFQRYARAKEKEKDVLPIVVQIDDTTFQVLSNGRVPLYEVAGALRAEILKARGLKSFQNWRELKKPGISPGTEPLYFRKGNNDILAWGSLTKPGVASWKTIFQTQERLVSVILKAIDLNWWPENCRGRKVSKKECQECSVYHWHLKRCYLKRSS